MLLLYLIKLIKENLFYSGPMSNTRIQLVCHIERKKSQWIKKEPKKEFRKTKITFIFKDT